MSPLSCLELEAQKPVSYVIKMCFKTKVPGKILLYPDTVSFSLQKLTFVVMFV